MVLFLCMSDKKISLTCLSGKLNVTKTQKVKHVYRFALDTEKSFNSTSVLRYKQVLRFTRSSDACTKGTLWVSRIKKVKRGSFKCNTKSNLCVQRIKKIDWYMTGIWKVTCITQMSVSCVYVPNKKKGNLWMSTQCNASETETIYCMYMCMCLS